MKNNLVLLVIAVIAVTASAQLLLPKKLNALSTKLTLHKGDYEDYMKGIIEGFRLPIDFKGIYNCFQEQRESSKHIINSVKLLESKAASSAFGEMAKGLRALPNAMRNCGLLERDTKTVEAILDTFAEAKRFEFQAGKKLEVNGIEIIEEITKGANYFLEEEFNKAGIQFGRGISKVHFANIQMNDPEFLKTLDGIDKEWEHTAYPQWDGVTLHDFRRNRLGLLQVKPTDDFPIADYDDLVRAVPSNFDSRTQWGNCVHAIRNQAQCGSCWAFGSSEALSDRFCIASNKSTNIVLGVQYQISCDTNELGCNGGYLNKVWAFFENTGIITDSCWGYQSGTGQAPACSSFRSCADGKPTTHYYAKSGTSKWFTTAATIQAEIYANGPVETGMTVYQDFYNYRSGIYTYRSGSELGGHAVKIIGWGVSGSTQYWIVANSWDTTWGMSGYFNIAFGQCGIDSDGIAGQADLSRLKWTL